MHEFYHIEQVLEADESLIQSLANLILDSVKNGASIGFMDDMTEEDAIQFWTKVLDKVAPHKIILLIARETSSQHVIGTVQLQIDLPKNQIHRADVAKMMVHSEYRRKGIAEQLLVEIEKIALAQNRHILVLDTVTGSTAQKLYQKCGWIEAGNIPDYAMLPNGELCSTTYFYKNLFKTNEN
ncbi:GNAT family N-acetyltransferase [Sphingobacterium corticibacter]|uniref:GNAT family N-acetyltransferase n=2 Tax=Sphingobacterium corticibacter TaxID=2171749 RepID=A0A2T8HNY5_9SPHI|nr:GNAT family N-acetyltransferase [Sphingobacterium corticibacter]